jgi:hypothetical protein
MAELKFEVAKRHQQSRFIGREVQGAFQPIRFGSADRGGGRRPTRTRRQGVSAPVEPAGEDFPALWAKLCAETTQ